MDRGLFYGWFFCVEWKGLIAGKPGSHIWYAFLLTMHIHCGSGLAREGRTSVYLPS